jgi:hypothetical protein
MSMPEPRVLFSPTSNRFGGTRAGGSDELVAVTSANSEVTGRGPPESLTPRGADAVLAGGGRRPGSSTPDAPPAARGSGHDQGRRLPAHAAHCYLPASRPDNDPRSGSRLPDESHNLILGTASFATNHDTIRCYSAESSLPRR